MFGEGPGNMPWGLGNLDIRNPVVRLSADLGGGDERSLWDRDGRGWRINDVQGREKKRVIRDWPYVICRTRE